MPAKKKPRPTLIVLKRSPSVLFRRREDCVELIDLNNASVVYKLDGLAQSVWLAATEDKTANDIITSAFSSLEPSVRKKFEKKFSSDAENLICELLEKGFLIQARSPK
jgi:hypothetical protein